MRPFLTFLSLFTLLFFFSPILCLGIVPDKEQTPALSLPEKIPYQGEERVTADLILGAVGAMEIQGYHLETLKAAAVSAATNLAKTYEETGTADAMNVITPEEAKESWGDYFFSQYWAQMQQAVSETWGGILTKDGAVYSDADTFPLSWGKTEGGVECPLDETANAFETTVTVPLEDFAAVFPKYGASLTVKNAQSSRVDSVASGNTVLSGLEMMQRFSLPSPAFTLSVSANTVTFFCKGQGDGAGMSLYGANEMAKQGADYKRILATFYPNATLQEANRELGSK